MSRKFSVGDIIRGTDANYYCCTDSDMTKGKVTHVYDGGRFDCTILEHRHPERSGCGIGREHTDLDPQYFELVPQFKVGDRVVATSDFDGLKIKGVHGTIRGVANHGFLKIGVEFDKNVGGHSLGNSGVPSCKRGFGYFVNEENIKLETKKFEVGQVYRVGECGHSLSGGIIKITKIASETVWPIEHQIVRGSSYGGCGFDEGSIFAESLTLLTGKQIGEAIRKWDADHAKKPEPEYKEVHRSANVGEKIKVVHACGNPTYDNGDIMTVTRTTSAGVWCGPDNQRASAYLNNAEYVVLEPKAEVREVERRAKVGEYIKIVDISEIHGGYESGDIIKVKNAYPNGVFGESTGGILHREYVVLEGYKPPKASKHIYTESEIAEAKRIVLDTIREQAENRKYVSFSFIGQVKDMSGFYAYVYGGDGCHLRIVPKVGLVVDKCERGKSKCSPNDEPNEWIGKCVALCKALHKPIPVFIMGD